MELPLVSVIVPAYNVGPYITQCLDSLVVQDLRQIEVIVVNDGSTDETGEIASLYAQSHANFRLINQENCGLSAARNAGMRAATGAYLGFVDGDDWVHSSMYGEMYRQAVDAGADIVIANGYLYNHASKGLAPIQDFRTWESLAKKARTGAFDPRQEPDAFLLDTSACKRLYRRQFLRDLDFAFPLGKIFEDVPTHYELLLATSAVALLDRPFYYYRTNRPGRITAKKDAELLQVFDVLRQVVDALQAESAGAEIWANYIWFQNWVLRWLRVQIDPAHAPEFDRRCVEIGQSYPPAGAANFKCKFASDIKAVEFVSAQLSGELAAERRVASP